MFNDILHNQWICRLKESCENKNVLIVGNSIKLCGEEYQDLIDSYDFVVRLGKGVPYKELGKHIGTKTDCWMTGFFRSGMHSFFKDVKFKILSYIPLTLTSKMRGINVNRFFFDKDFQIYKDYFTIGPLSETTNLVEFPVKSSQRPSQGYVAANFFMNTIKTYKSLNIIGFDFFESRLLYKQQNCTYEVSSFHIPLPEIIGKDSNPHSHSKHHSYEKTFFLDQEAIGNIRIHKMKNNPSPEILQTLMGMFRPDGKIVELK